MRFPSPWLFITCRRVLPALLVLLVSLRVYSQPYGNEWIQYNQKYFSFPVYQDGLHRLTFETLQNAATNFGIQMTDVPPGNFQVWSRGQQLYLNVCLGQDGVFNAGDFIDFYARKNDGWLDSEVYVSSFGQINKGYSLFNDTAYCYFSWNSSGSNPRMTKDTAISYTSYVPLTYVMATQQYNFHETYLEGERHNTTDPDITIGDPRYTAGEGYSGNKIWVNNSQTRLINLDKIYAQGPPATLRYTVVGGSNRELNVSQHHLKVDLNTTLIMDTSFEYNNPVTFTKYLPVNLFPGGTASLVFRNIEIPGQIMQEWTSVSDISILYPRSVDFSSLNSSSFIISDNQAADYTYIKLIGLSLTSGDSLLLFDLDNKRYVPVIFQDGFINALIKNFQGEEHCYFIKNSGVTIVQKVDAVDSESAGFVDYTAQQFMQNIDYLIVTNKKLLGGVNQYADYRRTNGYPSIYHPLVVDIDQLYGQYSFGIPKHPLALRNFLRLIEDRYPQQLKHLFLVGKAFQAIQYRNDTYYYKNTLLPTWGFPPSDVIYSLGLTQTDVTRVAVGRLSSSTVDDVSQYLNKVSQFESSQQFLKPGLKNVIQFGGGNGFFQQTMFRNYLLEYDQLLQSPFFGARVFNFFKSSTTPTEVNQSEYLHEIFENKGISMMNFFAHASGISFDYSPGDPADYNNQGKYYFVTANSCWAGDIFDYHGGLSSERYVLIPEKGAIGYLASVTEGEAPYLHTYTKRFFSHLSGDLYGRPVGAIIARTITDILQDSLLGSFGYRETCCEMTLHGDPALVINSPPFADYDMAPADDLPEKIQFLPEEISTELDSFRVMILAANNGKALDTSIFIQLKRRVGNVVITDTILRIKAPYYLDTIYVTLPVDRDHGAGLNTFTVTLDPFNEIDENNWKFNNTWERDVMIISHDLFPLLPQNFEIIPDSQVRLVAVSSNPFSPLRNYKFELDTSPRFDSPLKMDTVITQEGGVITWDLVLPDEQDSTVYFWRCGSFRQFPDSVIWRERSFQFIAGRSGWSQAHFTQMAANDYKYVHYDADSMKFVYMQEMNNLTAQTYIINHPWQEECYKINNRVMDTWSCVHTACGGSTGLKFAVFNPVSFDPWYSYDTLNGIGPYGNRHCRDYPVASFDFCNDDSLNRQKITDFIQGIPQGYYVLSMSHKSPRAQQFEESLYEAYESLGSGQISMIADTSSYILFGRKGWNIGQALESGFNSSRDSLVKLSVDVETSWDQGSITTPLIGPSSCWHSIHCKTICDEKDSVGLIVLGVLSNGVADTLLKGVAADSANLVNLEQLLPAKIYPYLRMILVMKDKNDNPSVPPTPAILKRWQVIYDGLPETCLDPASEFSFHSDTLLDGDSIRLRLAYHNVSDKNMDSLLVMYFLKNNNSSDTIIIKKLREHPAQDILVDSLIIGTRGRTGDNELWIEANPYNDQPEVFHGNNIGMLKVFVAQDNTNPVLDVTFDGVRILDYDYVSDKAKIEIVLNDDSPFLRLIDTSLIQVWLAYEQQDEEPLFYAPSGSTKLIFSPVTGAGNSCRVTFTPDLTKEGVYRLRVSAVDASSNPSGEEDYIIHFTVLHSSLQSEVIAIPNPFRDYTRFAFVLSGPCVPDDISMVISDVTGRTVRYIDKLDFGTLHIGTNLSDYVWDGRDQQGKELPDGMYLIKVRIQYPCEDPASLGAYQGKYYHFTASNHGKVIIMR